MPQYLNSKGQAVSASEATFDGKRTRPGYSAVIADGERVRMQPGDYLGFNIDMVDNRTPLSSVYLTDGKKEPASIDEAFLLAIQEKAKAASMKPSDWMATQRPDDIEKIIATVATEFVARAGATGVASAFTFDAASKVSLEVAMARASHHRKFAFMGDRAPPFNEQSATAQAQTKVNDAAVAESREGIRRAHWIGR